MAMRSKALFAMAATLAAASAASAQQRPYTPSLSCASVKAIVAQRGRVVLATSPNAYETVHLDSGACRGEVSGVPAFEPTLDEPHCFAGWRCKQRNNDGTGQR